MSQKQEIKISVRNLVEFILRFGSITSGFVGSGHAVEGTKIHKKVQQNSSKDYEAEVTLKHTIDQEDFLLIIEGRADGIITENDKVVIDEIKSVSIPLESIQVNTNPLHWAQARFYGYIYSMEHLLEKITIQLTYYHRETHEIKYLREEYTIGELKNFFQETIDQYIIWVKMQLDWQRVRNQSIDDLAFPYKNYRKNQRELAVGVYRTISQGKTLYAQAPTGTGKTISTLFPSIKAMGQGHISKVFYLTAKTITRTVAEEALQQMRQRGLKFKAITLTAKEKICFKEKVECNPESCEYACGHYDRINTALQDILMNNEDFNRRAIEEYSRKHKVCPFELSLDIALFADGVICDYNYVFDPSVYLKRFFETSTGDFSLLIDEAHNLVDRSREMYSAQLCKSVFLQLKKKTKDSHPRLSKALQKINQYLLDMRRDCAPAEYYVGKELDKKLYGSLMRLLESMEVFLLGGEKSSIYEDLLQLYFEIRRFLKIWEFYDEKYVIYLEKEKKEVRLKLFCLDPSNLLASTIKKSKATVFFSATLIPLLYYRDLLGGQEGDYIINMPTPFDSKNQCVMVANTVSTRYRDREKSVYEIVEYIHATISVKTGNYMVFFPSYTYMNNIFVAMEERYPALQIHMQSTNMSEVEREQFLKEFKANPEKTVVGFCVLGGIFSEGIDLKDDRLIGSIIVGVGLPKLSLERNILRDYFREHKGVGYEYAYVYPGMNKVLQAAGRVIRSETDRGIVLLIDERFGYGSYHKLFPREWLPHKRINNTTIEKYLREFWKSH